MLRSLSTSLAFDWMVSNNVKFGVPCTVCVSLNRLWMWSNRGSSSSTSL